MFGWNTSAGHLLLDPKGYTQFLQEQGDVGELAGRHPDQFAKSLIDWNDWNSGHPGRASGQLSAWVATAAGLSFADGGSAADVAVVRDSPATPAIRLPSSESWSGPASLTKHFEKHGADFGSVSEDEYASQASAFLQLSQAEGMPTKIDSTGVIRIYDPKSNSFGAFNADGTTRTFFKPNMQLRGRGTNWDYWIGQPGLDRGLG
jgi:hypothetical protein